MKNEIRQQLNRRWELKCQLRQTQEDKEKLEKELFPLYIAMHNEQVDVENLESRSIRNWFLDATGKKESMLMKERREAQTAKRNHDAVLRKLEYAKEQLVQFRQELEQLRLPPEGDWEIANNADLILQELRSALDTGNGVLRDNESMILQINNLIEQNRWGINKSMMPSYLATAQKKINLLKARLDLFTEEASNLPLQQAVIDPGTTLLVIDEHLMDQVSSGLGADMLLGESYGALLASKKKLQAVLDELERLIAQMK